MNKIRSLNILDNGGRKFFSTLLALLLLPALASAQTPTDYVRTHVDAAIAILTDPQNDRARQEQLISDMADTFFNAQEMSKRTLAQYWRTFRPEQRQEFQQVFLDFIKSVYLKKASEYTYTNEKFIYNQEMLKSETQAEVHTTLTGQDLSVPVVFFLIKRDGNWGVYDISAENVSLIRNYRSQFQSLLQQNSPDQLISILKEKIHE
jgi:phospholipid transport system substrate-binding protein